VGPSSSNVTTLSLVLALTAILSDLTAQNPAQKIGIKEARILAYDAVKLHNPGADITSRPRGFDPDFFYFEATWPNPTGSPIIGYFAVNPWTGDVWDAGLCERVISADIKTRQEQIRKRTKLKKEDFEKMHNKRPRC